LYFNPKLQAQVPEELRPRKQGKTCFNFQRPDAGLFAQLDELTRIGRQAFERHGFLEPGAVPAERLTEALRAGGEDREAIGQGVSGRRSLLRRAAAVVHQARSPIRPAAAPLSVGAT